MTIFVHPHTRPIDASRWVVASATRSAAAAANWFCSHRLALLVMAVLAVGTTLSIATTPDKLWWQLHFSRLGTFDNFSGYVFNLTLVAAGLMIVGFATRVRVELHVLALQRRRRPSALLVLLMGSVGVNLALVGVIPVHTNEFLHDRAASGVMLSFLGILIVTLRMWRRLPKRLTAATLVTAALLALAIVGFTTGVLNLAVLELVGFTAIFAWIGVFTRCVRRGLRAIERRSAPAEAPAPATAEGSASGELPVPVPGDAPVRRVTAPAAAPAQPSPSSRYGLLGRQPGVTHRPRRAVRGGSAAPAWRREARPGHVRPDHHRLGSARAARSARRLRGTRSGRSLGPTRP